MTLKKQLVIYLFTLYFERKQKYELYLCEYWAVLHIPDVSSTGTLTDVACCLADFLKQLQTEQPYYYSTL